MHGEQTETKVYMGRVEKYWPKARGAGSRMHHGTLKVGKEIYLIGKETGARRILIDRIEMENKQVDSCKKNDFIGIKIPDARKGDEIYLIKKK